MQLLINSLNVLYFKCRKPRVTPFSFCPTVLSRYRFHIVRVISTKRENNKKKEGNITKADKTMSNSQSSRADELAAVAKMRYEWTEYSKYDNFDLD